MALGHQADFSSNCHSTLPYEHLVTVSPHLLLNSADAAIASTLRGYEITRALDYQVEAAISEGQLVRVLTDFKLAEAPVNLLHQAVRRSNPNIRAFIDEAQRTVRR